MLNLCGIVVAILKMSTGRNFSMSGINSGLHNLPTYEMALKLDNVEFWPFEEISIFSNSGHPGYRTALTDTFLKGTHPGTIPAKFGLIWFSGFRGEDLNVIFYQNLPNLHNRYISAERKISQKNPEYLLNYSLPCSCT
jgi:hypothetical protein